MMITWVGHGHDIQHVHVHATCSAKCTQRKIVEGVPRCRCVHVCACMCGMCGMCGICHLAAEHVAEGKAVEDFGEKLEHPLVVLVLHL